MLLGPQEAYPVCQQKLQAISPAAKLASLHFGCTLSDELDNEETVSNIDRNHKNTSLYTVTRKECLNENCSCKAPEEES